MNFYKVLGVKGSIMSETTVRIIGDIHYTIDKSILTDMDSVEVIFVEYPVDKPVAEVEDGFGDVFRVFRKDGVGFAISLFSTLLVWRRKRRHTDELFRMIYREYGDLVEPIDMESEGRIDLLTDEFSNRWAVIGFLIAFLIPNSMIARIRDISARELEEGDSSGGKMLIWTSEISSDRALVTERDEVMASNIVQYLQSNDVDEALVVVGAGHVHGVVNHLLDDTGFEGEIELEQDKFRHPRLSTSDE